MIRPAIKSVLHNFLGTYTSRYSDYEGYWLFGFLFLKFRTLRIDLLLPNVGETDTPEVAFAIQLASQRFKQQLEKAGINIADILNAAFIIRVMPEVVQGVVNNNICWGQNFRFTVKVKTIHKTKYERELSVFVAPHNPKIESRRLQEDWGPHSRIY